MDLPCIIASLLSLVVYCNHEAALYWIIGTDVINVTLILGLLIINKKKPFEIDRW